MALLKTGSYKNTGTVYLDYKLYAEQLWGSGTSRAIRVTVEFKCGGNPSYPSWYGYTTYWQPYINSTNGSTGTIKGTESWNTNNGYRSFSQDITVNVGTTSATTVNVGFVTNSEPDNGWDGGANASFSVNSTNTSPWFQAVDVVTADDTTGNKYIPESHWTIITSWPTAYDNDGNLAGYRIRVSINGGGYNEIGRTTSNVRTFTHSINGYVAGTSFRYAVDAFDYESAWSGVIYSGTITKNALTKATLSTPSEILYNTTSIVFSWSGASNQIANSTFNYVLSCNELNLYGGETTATTLTVPIVATAPTTGPYILKSDLINYVKNNSYKAGVSYKLTTSNLYGSSGSDTKSSSINLQSPPATPAPVINTTDDTPDSLNIWRTAADTKNRYMIPNGTRRIRVSWPAVGGAVGEPISYDVFYRLDGGGYISLGNQSNTSYMLVLPPQSEMHTINFMVRAKSSYGLISGDGVSLGQNIHYYRPPYLMTGKYIRTDTTATLQVMCKSESSIPNINTKGTYVNTTAGGAAIALPLSQTSYSTLNLSGLVSQKSYTITFVYNDSTGFTPANTTETYIIGPNLPAFFFNKYGIGAGGFKADVNNALKINGGGFVKGPFAVEGNTNVSGNMNAITMSCTGRASFLDSAHVNGDFSMNCGANIAATSSAYEGKILSLLRANGTQLGLIDIAGDGLGYRFHTYGYDSKWDGQFSIKPYGNIYFTQANAGAYNFDSYKNWDDGGFASTGGGAAMINDNGTYKALMLLGNNSAGGYRRIEMYDDVNVNNRLSVGGNPIMATEWTANGRYVKYYNGWMECFKTVHVITDVNTAWGNIYASGYKQLGGWAHNFISEPYVTVTMSGTATGWSSIPGTVHGATANSAGKTEFYRGGWANGGEFWIQVRGNGFWKNPTPY